MPAVTTQLNDFIMPAAPAASAPTVRKPSWFSRALAAVQDARMRQAEREIAFLIERGGGRMTDDLERRIERSLI